MSKQFHFVEPETAYGKIGVRLLKNVRRHGEHYDIKQIEVQSELCLKSKKDYLHGDNGDIIPTDTQKNTIYALAKQHGLDDSPSSVSGLGEEHVDGLESIEGFALRLIEHFLTFDQVHTVKISIEETPWQRIKQNGQDHAHAFIYVPDAIRFCTAQQSKGGKPSVSGGLKEMRILKTTKSGFVGFHKDRFTILPEATNRLFSTVVYAKYDYSNLEGVCYNTVWKTVKDTILEVFSGPPDTGVYSKSVQETLYKTAAKIMNLQSQIGQVEIQMPNVHYFGVNMAPYGIQNNDEILMPTDNPSGNIRAVISRNPPAKL